jgi:biopolymer transport protein ExbD
MNLTKKTKSVVSNKKGYFDVYFQNGGSSGVVTEKKRITKTELLKYVAKFNKITQDSDERVIYFSVGHRNDYGRVDTILEAKITNHFRKY